MNHQNKHSLKGGTNNMNKTNIIKELRSLIPDRPLDDLEARGIAERQATRLLALVNIDSPAVPSSIILELPRIEVQEVFGMSASGASTWKSGRWQIQLNSEDHPLRQRFSLAHELKHILDHPYIDRLYQGHRFQSSRDRAEGICDFFAACLLMPRPWVKQAFAGGIQTPGDLSRIFGVSQAAMSFRLVQLGLVDPRRRCATPEQKQAYLRQLASDKPRDRGSTTNFHAEMVG